MIKEIMAWLTALLGNAANNLLSAVLVLVIGLLVIRVVMSLVKKALEKSKLEKAAHTLILSLSRVALYVLLALSVASSLGIDVTGVVALASVLTLAVSLSVQNLLTNVFGGFTLLYTKPFVSEDFVEIAGQSGTVKEIGLSYTKLATADNKIVSIPNSAVVAAQIINYTAAGLRRLDIDLEVSYGVNGEIVLEMLKNAAKQPQTLEDYPVAAVIKEYNAQTVTYGLMLWCHSQDYWDLKFAVNRALSQYSKEAGITFCDPKITVQVQK